MLSSPLLSEVRPFTLYLTLPLTQFTDPSQVLRTKSAFLLSQLVLQIPSAVALSSFRSSTILSVLLESLSSDSLPTGPDGDGILDLDYQEKALRVLVGLVERLRESQSATTEPLEELNEEEKTGLKELVSSLEGAKGWKEEDVGLGVDEWKAFKDVVEEE